MFGAYGFGQGYFAGGPMTISRVLNICTTTVRTLMDPRFVRSLNPLRAIGNLNPFRVVGRKCDE